MKRVFVSYSRNNLEVVTQLIEDLQAIGIEPWHDQTLTGGQRWWDNILENIRNCDIFVFALSPESWDSEACKSELAYVCKLGKTILPVLVSEGVNIKLLPAPLNEIQVIDYQKRDRAAVFALVKSINTTPPPQALPDPLPEPPPVPVSYLSTIRERIDAPQALSPEAQITLLFELEEELREGRSPAEVRDLFLRLKQRDELLAKVGSKIDAALKSLEEKSPANEPAKKPVHRPKAAIFVNPNAAASPDRPPLVPMLCSKCRTPLVGGIKFCGTCGTPVSQTAIAAAAVGAPGTRAGPGLSNQRVPNSTSRRYVCDPSAAQAVIAEVRSWLDSQDFDSQQMDAEDESLLLQIKKRGSWREWVGMATSLNILFHLDEDTLTVEIGAGKWIDKAAAGTVSLFILWPLAFTAGYGAWEQSQMPDKIFEFVGSRLTYK